MSSIPLYRRGYTGSSQSNSRPIFINVVISAVNVYYLLRGIPVDLVFPPSNGLSDKCFSLFIYYRLDLYYKLNFFSSITFKHQISVRRFRVIVLSFKH